MSKPQPLTPTNCDLRDMEWFPLYRRRLLNSEFWTTASDLARSRSVDLWCEAMDQIPAGSLPSNPVFLAQKASFGRDLDAWRMSAEEIMEPWVLCSDGRYYHPVLCEVALEVWERKLKNESDKQADARRKREARAAKKAKRDKEKALQQELNLGGGVDASDGRPAEVRSITDTYTDTLSSDTSYPRGAACAPPAHSDVADDVAELFGNQPPPPSKPQAAKPKPSAKQRYRIPDDWAPPADMIPKCADKLGLEEWEIRAAVPEFIDHWQGVVASKARKSDLGWRQAFNNQLARIVAYPSLRHALKTSEFAPAHSRAVTPNGVGHASRRNTGLAAASALRLLNGGIDEHAGDGESARDGGENYPRLNAPAR